ncbi:MAG: hypothetical protein IKK29_06805 [Christensenellaceae bacterium]|nr:hypothetical protein [Christensenellaceae bacterium]
MRRGIFDAELIAMVCRMTEKPPKLLIKAIRGKAICGGSKAAAEHPEENSRIPDRSAFIKAEEIPRIPTIAETALKSTIAPRMTSMLFMDSAMDSEKIVLIFRVCGINETEAAEKCGTEPLSFAMMTAERICGMSKAGIYSAEPSIPRDTAETRKPGPEVLVALTMSGVSSSDRRCCSYMEEVSFAPIG